MYRDAAKVVKLLGAEKSVTLVGPIHTAIVCLMC